MAATSCVGALQAFQVQPFVPLFSTISHHIHRYRLEHYSRTVKSGSKMLPKKPFLLIFYIKHFARYEFCIVFVSSKLSWELFSVFCTLAYFPADVTFRHLYMEEVRKHSIKTGKQRPRKWLWIGVFKKKISWGGWGVQEILVSIWGVNENTTY